MAKQIPHDDSFGNHYEASYWRVAQINIDVADQNANVILYGYKDAEARAAFKQPIGQKSYPIPKEKFTELYAKHLAPGGPNIMQLVYGYINTVLDVPDPTEEDPNHMKNFFEGGLDV